MSKTTIDQAGNVTDKMAEFVEQNPNLADAMRLFDITTVHYQAALTALDAPRIIQTTSTAATSTQEDTQKDGELE